MRQQPSRLRPKRTLRRLRPLAVAAAIVALIVAIAVAFPRGPEPEIAADTVQFDYRVEPAAATQATASNLRERLSRLGVTDAKVATSATGVTITAPAAARADIAALTRPGALAIYDWEVNVLGPGGRPVPEDESVTGGENAGQVGTLSESEAKARGTAFQTAGGGWFALAGVPSLTNPDIAGAATTTDPAVNAPVVVLRLTARGRRAFRALMEDVSGRGYRMQRNQHLAITLDDRLLSVPYVVPLSVLTLHALTHVQISGDLTPRQRAPARRDPQRRPAAWDALGRLRTLGLEHGEDVAGRVAEPGDRRAARRRARCRCSSWPKPS